MRTLSDHVCGLCHKCGEVTEWRITHRLVRDYGIRHCLQCVRCGSVVPDFAWDRYQETGRVTIPV